MGIDKLVNFWDLREKKVVRTYECPAKPMCCDYDDRILAIGLSNETVTILRTNDIMKGLIDAYNNTNNLGPEATPSCIGIFKGEEKGIALGTFEGRVNFAWLNKSIFTYKAHRNDKYDNFERTMWPIHSLGFSTKKKNFLFTAGGEGDLIFWDKGTRNMVKKVSLKIPITKAKLSPNNEYVAYGLGYDWAEGIKGNRKYQTKFGIHIMQENEWEYN